MTHLICRLFTPGMPHDRVMRQIELLAREVAPAPSLMGVGRRGYPRPWY